MNLKHTPGPWTIVYSGVNGRCIYADGKHIASEKLTDSSHVLNATLAISHVRDEYK